MKSTVIAAVILILITGLYAIPHPVYVEVRNADNEIPQEGDIHFEAWLLRTPFDFLTEDSTDCYYPAFGSFVKVNVDMFPNWLEGDNLHLEVWEISSGNRGWDEYEINPNPSQIYPLDEGGIYLTENHPIVSIELPDQFTLWLNENCLLDFFPFITGNGITLTAQDSDHINIYIDRYDVILEPESEWTGTESINFTVTGLSGFEDVDTVQILVEFFGDVDNSGSIDSYDAALILRYALALDPGSAAPLPWEEWRIIRADADGNGNIEAYDASLILQYLCQIIPDLPYSQY